MTNSKSIAFHQLPVTFPIPGMIKVIAIIQRIEILVRRRKNRQTSSLSLTDYSTVFYSKCLSLLLRGSDMTLQIILRISPKYFFHGTLPVDKARIVNISKGITLGAHTSGHLQKRTPP